MSSDHFSVDGTMIQAWSLMKSVKPIEPGEGPGDQPPPSSGRHAEADFHGETRSNATHASTTDPDAKFYKKGLGVEAKLACLGHALMEMPTVGGLLLDKTRPLGAPPHTAGTIAGSSVSPKRAYPPQLGSIR